MLFASLVIEREPPRWDSLPAGLIAWVQDAGIVAALALVIWWLAYALRRPPSASGRWSFNAVVVLLSSAAAFLCYGVFGVAVLSQGTLPLSGKGPATSAAIYNSFQQLCLTVGGACALLAVTVPVLTALVFRLRWRRIWALARLSIKEALRGRVLYVFALMAIVFLFADYFVPYKPEDQIRNYVMVVYWSMAPLFIIMAALLGAFSIPTDVIRQTIHTIVTKPVERFEIVLGRFLGNALLLSVALFALTSISLIYVARGVTPEAAEESYKARVPLFGDELTFHGTTKTTEGESVGREWGYRSYIRGINPQQPEQPKQYAIWSFQTVPTSFADRAEAVPFEFSFDIFRTTKSEMGAEGVFCDLTFADGRLTVRQVEERRGEARKTREKRVTEVENNLKVKKAAAKSAKELDDIEEEFKGKQKEVEDDVIRAYGIFEEGGTRVVDYHTKALKIPTSLFQGIREAQQKAAEPRGGDTAPPALKVLVSLGEDRPSRQQLLGVAKYDLYLLEAELPFWQNFLKGMLGLWCRVLLVLGIAVACSTYLSGIISLLCTLFLYTSGIFVDYIRALAEGRVEGGGPLAALTRLVNRVPLATPLDETPGAALINWFDSVYRWGFRTILTIVPDVNRHDFTNYVADGFDIPWGQVLFLDNFLPLAGYLLPWAILAYYLINSREVANPS